MTREEAVRWCASNGVAFIELYNDMLVYVCNGRITQRRYRMTDKNLLQRAVSKLGSLNQLRQAQEEAGELIAAINQYSRGRIGPSVLAEEVADMEIMIEQARVIVGDEAVDEHKKFKLKRLRALVEGVDV